MWALVPKLRTSLVKSLLRKQCFLASNWLKYETLPQKFRTPYINFIDGDPVIEEHNYLKTCQQKLTHPIQSV